MINVLNEFNLPQKAIYKAFEAFSINYTYITTRHFLITLIFTEYLPAQTASTGYFLI